MTASRGTLTMQRLAVRLIERRDPDDAIVLGDALMQKGLEGFFTGRTRPVTFRTLTGSHSVTHERTTTPDEREMIARTRAHRPGPSLGPTFEVQGREVIYNVSRFAAAPTSERWGRIWTMWITTRRDIYRGLVSNHVLPRTIQFRDVRWRAARYTRSDLQLAYDLLLERIPPRRKKPVAAYLFTIVRDDEDNPNTRERHFDDEHR